MDTQCPKRTPEETPMIEPQLNFRSFDAWIEFHFGTFKEMGKALGLTDKRVNRWYTNNPKHFFSILPDLLKYTKSDADELVELISNRVRDVETIKAHRRDVSRSTQGDA